MFMQHRFKPKAFISFTKTGTHGANGFGNIDSKWIENRYWVKITDLNSDWNPTNKIFWVHHDNITLL